MPDGNAFLPVIWSDASSVRGADTKFWLDATLLVAWMQPLSVSQLHLACKMQSKEISETRT